MTTFLLKDNILNYIIKTERLQLRHITPDDAPFILELMNSDGWLKYIGDRNIVSLDIAKEYIVNTYMPFYPTYGFGPYVLELKETKEILGVSGLYKRESLPIPDVGFAMLPSHYKRGYAYEAALAVLHYAKDDLKLTAIGGITIPENIGSIRLLKKLGLAQKSTYLDDDSGETLLYFEKTL